MAGRGDYRTHNRWNHCIRLSRGKMNLTNHAAFIDHYARVTGIPLKL